jgi:hypothetical protein
MLADALYCNYFPIASLMATDVDVLFEQNGSRTSDFRRGQSPLLDHRRVSKDDLPHQAHRAVEASSRECEKEEPNPTLGSRRPGLTLEGRFNDTGLPGPRSKRHSRLSPLSILAAPRSE